MALAELIDRLGRSFEKLRVTHNMDAIMMKSRLNEITCALLDADFPRSIVNAMEKKSQEIINLPATPYKAKRIYQIFLDELLSKLDPGKSALIQGKLEPSIVMFIGLRGVEKTKICAKYARFHRKKGFKPALVYADTLKVDAFVRLQKAAKDDLPVYGRIQILLYMSWIAVLVKLDLIKLKHSSKISLLELSLLLIVAAAKCPMILAETGEKSEEFEAFEAETFVKRLLENPWDIFREKDEKYALEDSA